MKKNGAFLFLMLFTFLKVSVAQVNVELVSKATLDVFCLVKDSESNLIPGAYVDIYVDNKKVRTLKPGSDSKIKAILYLNNEYTLIYNADGYMSKVILFNTMHVPPNDALYGFDFPIELKLEKGEGDKMIIVNVFYNVESGFFELDPNFTSIAYKEKETGPKFPGGNNALVNYLKKNLKYPIKLRDKGISGTVVMGFVVAEDGNIEEIKQIKKSAHPEFDAEALKIIELMPKWKPATIDGNPVRVDYKIPINFTVKTSNNSTTSWSPYPPRPGLRAEKSYKKAERLFDRGTFEKAIFFYTDAIKWYEDYHKAYYKRGMSNLKLGKMDEACEDWKKAVQLGSVLSSKMITDNCN